MARPVLSFDLTGTLATNSFCNSIWFEGLPKLYSERYGLSFDMAKEYLIENYDELGDGVVEWYDLKYWFNRFNLGDGWMNLLVDYSRDIEFYPEVIGVLERCRQRYELILITNASREFAEMETADIRGYFSKVISSVSDFGEVKKTPEFYGRVCHSLGIKPQQLIHVGDHWQFDFVAPKGLGVTAFYLDRTKGCTGESIIHNLNELGAKLL